jgi:tape measure domain-containing protein
MPTQVWTLKIDGPDVGPIRSFQQVLDTLKSSSGQVASSLQVTEREIGAVGSAATRHGPSLTNFFKDAASAATGFLAANVFQGIISGLAGIGQGAIGAAADMERTRAGFTSILGSAQQANALIAQLQREANVSPFELDSFRKASQLLLGMGVAAGQIVPQLHEVSNVTAAVGGGTEQFDRITLALAQIQAKGKVSAQEINQLAENGVAGWDILARALNTTRANVIDLATQGKISADTFMQAFAQFANSPAIAQAAEKQSHTFSGLVSTIHDIGQALEVSFAGPLLTSVEPTLERIIAGLQDPQVVATLAQWGAAAGQFVVGLIQAGETAFQVGGQILAALKPVTDAIGQLLGIQGGPALQLPDFQPVVLQTQAAATNTAAVGAQVKSVKDQIAGLERQQREETRAAQETELSYTHQSDAIKAKIRALQDAYDLENRSADRAALVAKIQKDSALAGDVISSQGQAAAKRLVDEKAQLAAMDRQTAFNAQKGTLEDQQRAIDAAAQKTREGNAARVRDTQAAIDDLRAKQAAAGDLGIPPPGRAPSTRVAGDDISDRYAQPGAGLAMMAAGAPAWATAITTAVDGVLAAVQRLTGANGLQGLFTTWHLVTDSFSKAGPLLTEIQGAFSDFGGAIGNVAHLLGIDTGLAKQLDAATTQTQLFFAAWSNFLPTWVTLIGGAIQNAVDGFATLGKGAALTATVIDQISKGQFDITQSPAVQAKFDDLIKQIAQDQQNLQRLGGSLGPTFSAGQAGFARDRATILAGHAAGVPAPVSPPAGSYNGPYSSQYALPPQSVQTVNVQVQVGFDADGLPRVIEQKIQTATSGRNLARNLGSYASSGR